MTYPVASVQHAPEAKNKLVPVTTQGNMFLRVTMATDSVLHVKLESTQIK